MKEGWIKVYTFKEEYQDELIKTLLEKTGLILLFLTEKTTALDLVMLKYMLFLMKPQTH